jgi:integrase
MKVVEPIRDIETVNDIADYIKARSIRNYVMFMFGIYTGLRISDILKFRVRDVQNKNYIYITEQKTKKVKRFSINPELKKILNEYVKDKKEFEFLFRSQKGINKAISREQAYRIFNEAATAFGLVAIGCHTLRKTFGYFVYQDTKDLALLKDIFNHSDTSVTMKYIGINQDTKDTVINSLNFNNKQNKRK